MTKPDYVYVTYIATTPEKVWQAVTDPEVTRTYWIGRADAPARVNVSDWKVGSRWEHQRDDETHIVDIAGTVLESTPPRRLVMTWARPNEFDDETTHSRVTFEIEPQGDGVIRLTVTHDDLAKDPKMLASVSGGWPRVLSNLKSLLEMGHALQPPRSAP
ncbi:MAG: SRPBCC family protein [bacterium]